MDPASTTMKAEAAIGGGAFLASHPSKSPIGGVLDSSQLNWISNYLFGIADDVLRDVFVSGKYRDVILPMVVLRRFDAVLEPTKQAVLEMKVSLDRAGITNQEPALRQAAGQAFYNTSKFTMRDLASRTSQQQLKADFEDYLDGFSADVQDILDNFEFRNGIPKLSKSDALGSLIEKLLSRDVNLSPNSVMNADGTIRHPGLDNHGMGTVFEELVRRWNEENNEEAGEHWTPRDAVRLMANLVFLPIADQIESGTYLLYDGACGTGGMLTVAEETLRQLAREQGKEISTHLYGQEIQAETYAIAKADLLLKGEGDEADNIVGGPEYSTLSNDAFPSREFDFMLSNPPYGKSWKTDLERMGGKAGIRDPRFIVSHGDDGDYSLVTRSKDGQMLFLANMLSKMKHDTKLGSRIAEVHNGSSLFTGDAGQGESNIRRWIIENDWLEAIIALPSGIFYNTPIATFVWVLSNRKSAARMGKVQLIDATSWFKPLLKNLGQRNCELTDADIQRICSHYMELRDNQNSLVLPNQAFGYYEVIMQRPLRLKGVDASLERTPKELRELRATHQRDGGALPLVRKVQPAGTEPNPARGRFEVEIAGTQRVVEYEPDPELTITERVPILEAGGPDAFFEREVLPHAPDAWIDGTRSWKIGYAISFAKYFAKPERIPERDVLAAAIEQLERETEDLIAEVTKPVQPSGNLRDTGLPWVGQVPGHWELVPNRALMGVRKELVGQSWQDYTLLSLTKRGIVARDMVNPEGKFPASFEDYQVVRPGDLIFCLFDIDETPRTVGLSDMDGMVTGAYTIFRCFDQSLAEYVYYYYLALDNAKALRPLYTGLRKVIGKDTFLNAKMPLPPAGERQRIVARVRETLRGADAVISRALREVELVEQYRSRLLLDMVSGTSSPSNSGVVPNRQ